MRRTLAPSWGVAIGALFVATTGVTVNLSGASPGTASVYRCVFELPFLLPLAVCEGRRGDRLSRRRSALAVAAGVLLGADMLLWTQAIAEVGAGLTAVIVNLQVVLVPALAWLVDREPASRRYLVSMPVVVLGVVFASGVVVGGAGANPLLGTVHAALAALCYSGFLRLLRTNGRSAQTFRSYALVTATAAVVSAAVGALWHDVDFTPSWETAGWLSATALCGQVAGWLLVVTPVGALVLSAIVLGERPTWLQLLGCALILGGVLVVTGRSWHGTPSE